jgi:hypothetical protein
MKIGKTIYYSSLRNRVLSGKEMPHYTKRNWDYFLLGCVRPGCASPNLVWVDNKVRLAIEYKNGKIFLADEYRQAMLEDWLKVNNVNPLNHYTKNDVIGQGYRKTFNKL